jgi:O-antigen/teichoic acid export membrane protein
MTNTSRPDLTADTPVRIAPAVSTIASDSSRRRYQKIFEAGASAIVSKGAVLLVNAISLPIAVRYLGPVQFGIWATITTTLSLLLVLDLGIANTLTNLMSEAYAKEDKKLGGEYAATAFWIMVLVAAALGVIGFLAWPLIHWDSVFHVDASLRGVVSRAVGVSYVVFLCGMPAGLAAKMLGGYQELRTANLFAAVGSVASLCGVIAVVYLRGQLPWLVGISSGAMIAANGICLLWLWTHHKPWLTPWPRNMSRTASRRLMQTGSEFFLIQLAGVVVFNSDNLVIAHFMGPAQVTPYNVTWRIVGYATMLQTVMMPALWPAYSEAYVRGEMAWIRKTFWRVMKVTSGVAAAFCIVFVLFGRTIIGIWAGQSAVPAQSLVIAMCIWVLINTVMTNEACLLVATNEIRLQMWLGIVGAAVNLVATIYLVKRLGVLGVIMGTLLSYILVVIGPQTWKVMRVMRATARTAEVKDVEV